MRSSKALKTSHSSSFNTAAKHSKQKQKKAPDIKPFCIRLTNDECAELDYHAGDMPLGTWARNELLGKKVSKRKKRTRLRKPKVSDKNVALVLALLGNQRIASNLNQLARQYGDAGL